MTHNMSNAKSPEELIAVFKKELERIEEQIQSLEVLKMSMKGNILIQEMRKAREEAEE